MTPDGFPKFRHTSVHRVMPGALTLTWVLAPHSWPESDLAFVIFRSNSPTGPFEQVGTAEPGRFMFADFNVISPGVSRNYYHIIRCASVSGKGFADSYPINVGHDPDNVAYEMIRKKQLFLTVRGGIASAVLLKKSWGARCSRCYNAERMMASDPLCPECYGTGFSGGYLNPVLMPALFNPPKQAVIDAGMKYEVGATYVELANYPYLSVDDIYIDRQSNIRYKVNEVSLYTRRGHIVSQVALVNRLEENDATYTILLPPPSANSFIERSWDMVDRDNPSQVLRNAHASPG